MLILQHTEVLQVPRQVWGAGLRRTHSLGGGMAQMGTWRSPETRARTGQLQCRLPRHAPHQARPHRLGCVRPPGLFTLPLGCEPQLLYQLVHPLPRPYSREALPGSVVLPPSSVPAAPVSLTVTAPFLSCPALPRTLNTLLSASTGPCASFCPTTGPHVAFAPATPKLPSPGARLCGGAPWPASVASGHGVDALVEHR